MRICDNSKRSPSSVNNFPSEKVSSSIMHLDSHDKKLKTYIQAYSCSNKDKVNDFIKNITYPINSDPNPNIITKKSNKVLWYKQEIAIRYLKPDTPIKHGDVIIKQEADFQTTPAPPLIIRQQPSRPLTPEPIIIKEAPPKPPLPIGKKIIKVSGRKIPPPPRKVIIERLPELPRKPQSIIVERWLPYPETKRKVIHVKPNQPDTVFSKPKNIIIQWEPPKVKIEIKHQFLGTQRADPIEYSQKYGNTLKHASELPDFVKEIKHPENIKLASDVGPEKRYDLEGDIGALNLVDLDNENLSEYKSYLNQNTLKDKYNYFFSEDSGIFDPFSAVEPYRPVY